MVSLHQRLRSWFILLGFTLVVAACGGGDDGPSPTPTPNDTTPTAFVFEAAADVALQTSVESNTVTISGINVAVTISVSDGEYSIGGGSYTSTSGTLTNGQTLTVRGTSSTDFSTTTVVGVTVGTVTETFTITTLAQDITPDAFAFTAQTDAAQSTVVESNSITVAGINDAAEISIANGEYAINGGDYTSAAGTVNTGDTVTVRQTSSSEFSTTTTATLTIGGVTGDFSVTTLAQDTTPEAFSFDSLTNVPLSSTAESAAATISGINDTATVSITNGDYAIGDGEYTNAIGAITNGQTIKVRTPTVSTFSTATVVTLVVGGVEATFTATTLAQDLAPDAYAFNTVTGVPINSVQTSNTVTISGINDSAPITITNGEYAINGGGFTSAAGTIDNGNTLIVRTTASTSFATQTQATTNIGGVMATFTVETESSDTTPDAYSFAPVTGAALGASVESNTITISGINDAAAISITNGEYRIDGGAYVSTAGTITSAQTAQVRLTASDSSETAVTATLTVGGVTGDFSVTTQADEEAPTAEIAFPPPISMTEGTTIVVRGTATDALGTVTRVTVNGGAEAATATSSDDFATWQATVTLTTAADNVLTIETEDSSGNIESSAATVTIRQDTTLADFPNSDSSFTDPRAVTIDYARNRAIIADADLDSLFTMDLTTGQRALLSDSSFNDAAHPWSQPEGFLIEGDILWVGDRTSDKLLSVNLLNGFKTAIATDDFPVEGETFVSAREMIVDPSDSNYFIIADEAGGIKRVNKNTGVRENYWSAIGFSEEVYGVVWDEPRTRILFLNGFSINEIGIWVRDGVNAQTAFSTNGSHPDDVQFSLDARSLQIDLERGKLYVADTIAPVGIMVIDLNTGDRERLLEKENPGTDNMFVTPNEVFFDGTYEYMLVVDAGLNAVLAVDVETGERVYYTNCVDD